MERNQEMRCMTIGQIVLLLLVPGLVSSSSNKTLNNDVRDLALLQQLNSRKSFGRAHWSSWSNWSPCSRTCDGGVSFQLRTCRSHMNCHGDAIRHKICNMQPCPEPVDFREEQCASYNHIPYHDTLFHWSAHHDANEPCALTCRGQPRDHVSPHSASASVSPVTVLDSTDTTVIVVQLSPRVHDGTRCRPGSLDMCISGKCQRVGCDLRIGSVRQIDECGVCGGDGSSCAQPLYHWVEASASLCSVTCGGGYKMSRPICKNRLTNEEVGEYLCNMSQRPPPEIVECNPHPCPARWTFEPWSACSTTCGPGTRYRQVYCAETLNGTTYKVNQQRCSGPIPNLAESCNNELCPSWVTSSWSECSVTCGEGVRMRDVTCSPQNGLCLEKDRPPATETCKTLTLCQIDDISYSNELQRGEMKQHHIIWDSLPDYQLPLLHPYPPIGLPATAERLVSSPDTTPSDATFIADTWGPCSVSCGEGVRRRDVQCKIFLELTRTVAQVPDTKCSGMRPPDTERCIRDPCVMDNRMELAGDVAVSDQYATHHQDHHRVRIGTENSNATYSWKEHGFTPCTASCLGGVQESIANCVRDSDQRVVSPFLCPKHLKPETITRTCNDHPCLPRWNYLEFKPCSKSCGMGIQMREVHCIHEVTRGSKPSIVPNKLCTDPPPADRKYCNVLDCPPEWTMGNWTKCSKPCGGGNKMRNVTCTQIIAQQRPVQQPSSMCSGLRPVDRKPCNTKQCEYTDRPIIAAALNQNYIQSMEAQKMAAIKVGGTAQVFLGTQLKVRCPVKRFDRSRIQWQKDQRFLPQNKRVHVSKKGALTIKSVTVHDAGLYTCVASLSTADLILTVKPLPGHFPNSEEVNQQHQIQNMGIHTSGSENIPGDMGQQNPFKMANNEDDLSHENRPDWVKPTKADRPRKNKQKNTYSTTTKTPPPLFPDFKEAGGVGDGFFSTTTSELLSSSAPSSSARAMPHFQHLLANLQTFGNARGYRTLLAMEDQAPLTTQPHHHHHHHHHMLSEEYDPGDEHSGDEHDEDIFASPPISLGKGDPSTIKFEWVLSDWSPCPEPCGSMTIGYQSRIARCMVRLENRTSAQEVRGALCEDAGLPAPGTVRGCAGEDHCAHWSAPAWPPCDEARCFAWHTAMQRREVPCMFPNGTEAPLASCPAQTRPPQRQECYNDKCRGTWKVGEWSECAAECEMEGIKYRILQCVWFGTKKPAGNACRDQPRPSVMKVCKGPPCSQKKDCKDHSQFCHSVLTRNMCRVYRFETQCCHTCRARLSTSHRP